MVKKAKATTKTSKVVTPQFEEINLEPGEAIEITPDMIIGDVAAAFPQTLLVFQKAGIHCIGCYASTFESIQEGCLKHNLSPKKICKALNEAIQKSKRN